MTDVTPEPVQEEPPTTADASEDGKAEELPDGEDAPAAANALRDNIASKGSNAYYYAHAHRVDAPAWDGQEAPRLLERRPSLNGGAADDAACRPITKYSWADCEDSVKVYVELDQFPGGAVDPDTFDVSSTEASLIFRLTDQSGAKHQLTLAALNDRISAARARRNKDRTKVIVTMTKVAQFTWHDLKKKE